MMAKLESVASEFRKASHAQMSATTQRTIRENVVTQSEASQFQIGFRTNGCEFTAFSLLSNSCLSFVT